MLDLANDLVSHPETVGPATEAEVLERVIPLKGLALVDVGCGGGRVSRQLVDRGATVLGVEPDPEQAAKNRAADPVPGLTFAQAPGQALPLDDASMDGVVFSFSMHHVPPDLMAPALAEALRVLRPTGFLCVFEPLLSGTQEQLYRPFHDESPVRRLAWQAVRDHAAPRFGEARELVWSEENRYDDFEAFVAENVSVTHMRFHRENIDVPQVRAVFEAGRSGDGFVFTGYGRADIFTGLKAA